MSIISGTLFKDMKRKPCILKDIAGTLGTRRPIDYTARGNKDLGILEDSSGRIRLKREDDPEFIGKLVTGSIMACLGRADVFGFFHV